MLGLLSVFAVFIFKCLADDLIVQLQDGKVQATTLKSPSGSTFYTWRHIPYAKPPVEDLRFKAPVRPDPWTDVLDGSEDSKACFFTSNLAGGAVPTYGYSEDCLYVNVYSPVPANSSLRLPVMFWIYGGKFVIGSGEFSFYDPTAFLEENVIVVTFNYRLGVLGFLSTEDQVLPGNAGLKDQLAALIWTRENIALFGGNPLDITIFGESAGSMSVGLHLISPMSRDLYTGAIMQSGSALTGDVIQSDARSNTIKLASKINSSVTEFSSSDEILQVLQAADADLLIQLCAELPRFVPVVEVDNPTPFLPSPMYESIEAGNITRVPLIIGTNSEEKLFEIPDLDTANTLAAAYDENPALLLPVIKLKDGVSSDTVTQEIKRAYVGDSTFKENVGRFVDWMSDDGFVRSTMKHAVLQSKYTPVYFYQLSFVGSCSANHPVIPGCGGVGHADDLCYFFNNVSKPLTTDADFLTRRRLVKLWTNFAKTKNPTPNDDSAELLQNVTWEPLNDDTSQYLDIGENLELKSNFKPEMFDFWDSLFATYSYRPYTTF